MMTKLTPTFKEIREKAHELWVKISLYFFDNKIPINEIIFVPSAILGRIIGTHDSIGALLLENYVVDAAIVTLASSS
jgi:hypothetical protein